LLGGRLQVDVRRASSVHELPRPVMTGYEVLSG
jgi:hypothetical protein